MKAAVITMHSVCNYGTQLQAYATQEKLKQYFDEVEFIDYRREDTYGIGLLKTYTKGNILKAPAILPTLIYWRHNFGGFRKKYLNINEKKYLKLEDFEQFDDFADIYFSGSDQVWNTGWNNGILPPLYLSFVPDNKPRYSYSSSFGKSKLDEEYLEETKKYLDKFEKITVREDSGVDILKNQLVRVEAEAINQFYEKEGDQGLAFYESLLAGDYSQYQYSKSLIGLYKNIANATAAVIYKENDQTEKYEECKPMLENFAKSGIGERWMKQLGLEVSAPVEEEEFDNIEEKEEDQ